MSNVLKGKEPINQVAKLMTIKDQLLGQIFFAVMYRKMMLFDDLSVNNDGKDGEDIYESPKVVEVYAKINQYVSELGYKPPKLIYEPITVQKLGIYTSKQDLKQDTAETLKDMVNQIVEMEQLFQKQLLFTEDKKR